MLRGFFRSLVTGVVLAATLLAPVAEASPRAVRWSIAAVPTPDTGVGIPWTPLQLGSALVAWWDASTGVAQSAGLVSAWTDRVGGLAASQATGSAQPAYSATARNGTPGLTFDGTDDRLTFTPSGAFPTGSANRTIAVQAYSGAAGDRYSFGYGNTNGSNRNILTVAQAPTTGFVKTFVGIEGPSTAETWSTSDRSVVLRAGGASLTFNVDGKADEAFTTAAALTTDLSFGAIGYPSVATAFWIGVIQQVLVFNRFLTTGERQQLEGWMSWSTGQGGTNLPAGHPYKSARPYQ